MQTPALVCDCKWIVQSLTTISSGGAFLTKKASKRRAGWLRQWNANRIGNGEITWQPTQAASPHIQWWSNSFRSAAIISNDTFLAILCAQAWMRTWIGADALKWTKIGGKISNVINNKIFLLWQGPSKGNIFLYFSMKGLHMKMYCLVKLRKCERWPPKPLTGEEAKSMVVWILHGSGCTSEASACWGCSGL